MQKICCGLIIIFIFLSTRSSAQTEQTITHGKYTLHVSGNDAGFSPQLMQRLIDVFFIVYPKLAKEYNKQTLTAVSFFIDTSYNGVAATDNGRVVFSAKYMSKHPADVDVVTHEVMHIVQNYGDSGGPGWLTEGIADFARNKFGVDNAGAGWSLPDYKPTQHYDNAYRVTARFLLWIEKNVKKGIVKKLDDGLRKHIYTDVVWIALTGKNLDQLWEAYAKNPAI
ncbi:basic secretory protein-like protein [Ferruginibacter sp.]